MGGQAYDAPRLQAFYLDPFEVVIIGLDTEDGPEHILYDERIALPISDQDVDNVIKHGVLKPGLVRKEKMADGEERSVVLDGRQRTRWARAANMKLADTYGRDSEEYRRRMVRVPFVPKQIGDEQKQASVMVAANHHKESDTMVKARQAQRMLDRGMSMRDIAADFAVTETAVGQWLKLLDLSDHMRAAVERGVLPASAAVQYSDISHDEQAAVIAEADKLGVKITTGKAREDRNKRARGDKPTLANAAKSVPSRVIRKLIDNEAFMEGLTPSERGLLCWVAGHAGMERRVRGLRAALKAIGYLDDDSASAEE